MPRSELEAMARAATQSSYLGESTALCRFLTKYLCYVDTRDAGVAPHLLLNGIWECWVTQALLRVVARGAHCLDVGANHGYYTIVMADAAEAAGRVVGVEPNPRLVELGTKSLHVNGLGNARIVQRAVSDRTGDRVELRFPPMWALNASMFLGPDPSFETIEAETVTIDDLTSDWDRVDVIKVDVEGAEVAVWRGMKNTIERNPQLAVILEFSPHRQYDGREFLNEIQQSGFKPRFIGYDSQVRDVPMPLPDSELMLFLQRQA